PPLLRHHIEVRGLGILDVKELFGITAIRDRKRIDLVVRMVEAADEAGIDRLGLDACTRTVLGVPIREVVLLVQPGRDTASILEMAARNELLRATGRNSSLELVQRVDQALVRRSGESGMVPALTTLAPGRGSTFPVRPPESYLPGAPPGDGGQVP
ncbi:MAG: HPr(Ser) kinase/phosphatase, partial [Deltaproteobacteria bacterium]|nr:HPr(Ser) kinase/phosphatase [Deltaproteobacteria bacterium]